MTNADLEKMVDTSDEWIRERTGIEERRIAAEGQTTCDLAEQASLQALEMAGVTPQELDLILVATTTPDKIFQVPRPCCKLVWAITARRLSICKPFVPDLSTP